MSDQKESQTEDCIREPLKGRPSQSRLCSGNHRNKPPLQHAPTKKTTRDSFGSLPEVALTSVRRNA